MSKKFERRQKDKWQKSQMELQHSHQAFQAICAQMGKEEVVTRAIVYKVLSGAFSSETKTK